MQTPVDWQPVLDRYRLPGLDRLAQPPGIHRGFSGATVYRISTQCGAFALRDWGPHCPPSARLRGLHRLLGAIHRDGVQTVSVPMTTDDGSTIAIHDGTVWQLEPWLPGNADFHANPSRERLANAMRALADWHRAARRFQPAGDEREWFRTDADDGSPAARERLQRILKWQRGRLVRLQHEIHRRTAFQGRPSNPGVSSTASEGRATSIPGELARLGTYIVQCFESAAPAVAAALQTATQWRFEIQPCLRDVWHDHVLFTGDDVTGLIDPSACRSENVASDLARLLGSFVADDRSAWEFAIDCYARHRDLRPAELRLLPILDRSSVLLSGLTWLDRYFFQGRSFPEPEAVYRRMEQIAQRLAHLTGRPIPAQSLE